MKSDLENDISAITMQPDVDGIYARNHEGLMLDARRKGSRSISRRTRKPVAESTEQLRLAGNLGPGVSFTCTLVMPPQPDVSRVCTLAHYQLAGFFYALSYESVAPRRGGYWPGGFFPVTMSLRGDWGNGMQKDFMRRTLDLDPRMIGFTSEKFFRMAVRRKPLAELWSWALEWNSNLRVIGFFGSKKEAVEEIGGLSRPANQIVAKHDRGTFRAHTEVPLSETEDTMFADRGGDWGRR